MSFEGEFKGWGFSLEEGVYICPNLREYCEVLEKGRNCEYHSGGFCLNKSLIDSLEEEFPGVNFKSKSF